MKNHSILFQAVVLSNQDPLMLGRIRARRVIDNYEDILKSFNDPVWNPWTDPWSERDPFIFSPLLPYFNYQTPKDEEFVNVLYLNKDFKFQNQYYVQSDFSSPTATQFEYNIGGNKNTGIGIQYTRSKPLKDLFGRYTDKGIQKGVFPEPGDNGLMGRGSADVIVKQEDVLLRAGKYQNLKLQPNETPTANQNRAFLQLSRFPKMKKSLPDKTIFEIEENVILVNYLIEWVITNPENTMNRFTGQVLLYKLKPDLRTNSQRLSVDSFMPNNLKTLVYETTISGTIDEMIVEINNFIKTCNDSNFYKGFQLFPDNNSDTKFPIYYRPASFSYSFLSPSSTIGKNADPIAVKHISTIFNKIKLNPSLEGGSGLIYAQNKVGSPSNLKKKVIPQTEYVNQPTTYSTLGGDRVFLLSHNSAIPGKSKINFNDTLYGISGDTFADEIMPKTSSMVRGEQLMELINLIVRFLVTHTHAYPGLPPIPVTEDGTSVTDILTELQNSVNKILNEHIRLN